MYTVTIKKVNGEYVASNQHDDWVARGVVDKERTGMDLALYLFHESEVVEAETLDGLTVVTIREANDKQANP